MRQIDADALTRELKSIKATFGSGNGLIEGGLEIAISTTNAMPTVNQWIPCSERLPKEKGEYLVTYHPCYHDIVEPEVKVGIDTFRGKTSWAKKKYQKVIAWKPKPLPWEGETDD